MRQHNYCQKALLTLEQITANPLPEPSIERKQHQKKHQGEAAAERI
jgi:hypothetical protein